MKNLDKNIKIDGSILFLGDLPLIGDVNNGHNASKKNNLFQTCTKLSSLANNDSGLAGQRLIDTLQVL